MAKRWHQQSKDVDGSTKKEIYFVVKYKGSILLLYLLSTYYVPGTLLVTRGRDFWSKLYRPTFLLSWSFHSCEGGR